MTSQGHRSQGGSVPCEPANFAETCRFILSGIKRCSSRLFCGAHPLLLAAVCFGVALCSCGGTNAGNSVTPTIAVSIVEAPPSTLPVGGTAQVSASVSDDVAKEGVDWVAMCGSAPACGSFSPAHTASGAATTFTAPIGVPAGNSVSVTALSTTDHSKSAAAQVTITSTVTGVTITQFPPAMYPAGGTVNVAATVAGDPSNEGVNWTATCGTVSCTSGFTAGTHSPAGVPISFTIPLPSTTFPLIVGSTVTLTAFATADHNFSAVATLIVTNALSINITEAPPASVLINTSVPVIAVVTNDPTNSGVTWTVVSCDVAPCGSWSANSIVLTTQVASGATATYTAPPTAVNHVVLQAAATASPMNAVQTVEISITAPISISITQRIPNDTIVEGATAPLIATVNNDAQNEGVDWTVTCGSAGACGFFTPTHTASGVATVYQAPPAVPTGNTVMITAKPTADPTKSDSETVTVTSTVPPDSLLSGQWILSLSGRDGNGGPYTLGGAIVGDGIGDITAGSLDLVDLGGGLGFNNAGNVAVTPSPASSYSIGADGRGQIRLTVNTAVLNSSFGVSGSGLVVLSVVFVTPQHALLSETDTFGSATGTLDLQNAADLASFQNETSGPNGIYSLSLTGAETAGSNPKYFVAAAVGLHSTGGSYTETSYIADQSDNGVITSVPVQTISQGFTNPTPNNYGEIRLNTINLGLPTQFNLDAWLIDSNHFVVTDWRDSFLGNPAVIIIGRMVAEPSSAALSGAYAFTEAGATAAPASLAQVAGGLFTCGSAGSLDVTPLGGTPVTSEAITVACSTPANASGRGLISISGAGPTGISHFAEYPTVDQGLYLIELDGGATGTSGPSGAGVVRQQTLSAPILASAFSGAYASNFLASTSVGLEAFAGKIMSDGVSLLSGTADVNSFNTSAPPLGVGTPSSNASLAGSFTTTATGRFPLALTLTPATGQPTPELTQLNPACYILDANTCLLLGLDATAPGTGILELQNLSP
jgi:hypothetical protein